MFNKVKNLLLIIIFTVSSFNFQSVSSQAQTGDPLAPDLVVEEIERLQDYVFPGNIGSYRARIKNTGQSPALTFKVAMNFNFETVCTHEISLTPGESKDVWCGYAASLIGETFVEIIADRNLSIRELNENNNTASAKFQILAPQDRTDIAASTIGHEPDEFHTGDEARFWVELTNLNKGQTGLFASYWFLNNLDEAACLQGVELGPQESKVMTCEIYELAHPESITMYYKADHFNLVIETNEDNNNSELTLPVLPAREVPYQLAGEPDRVEAGDDSQQPVDAKESDTQQVLGVADSPVVSALPQTFEGLADMLLNGLPMPRDLNQEEQIKTSHINRLQTGVPMVTEPAIKAIIDFIAYGVDENSISLGAGERGAVLYSYKDAYGRLPQSQADFADVIRLVNGRWPVELNLEAQDQAHLEFYKIYHHVADMQDPHENAAITVMTYGLRQQAHNRNLDSEKTGIKTFRAIYGYSPQSTRDWNIMQAITYSGASR